jgi:hypothetical protein
MSTQADQSDAPKPHLRPIAECRELIGALSAHVTDEQVSELRAISHLIGEAIYNRWQQNKARQGKADSPKNDGAV